MIKLTIGRVLLIEESYGNGFILIFCKLQPGKNLNHGFKY